jgi:glutamate-1-semialdehyde 2,1-aminomutase
MNTAAAKSIALDQAVAAAESRFAAANPRSRQRHERARTVLPGGHSRQTLYYAPFPLTIAGGAGACITDLDGHEYLNLVGDFAAGVFGHQCEPIQRAVLQTLRSGLSLSGPNMHEVEFAELISRRIPSMEQLRFCNSGSEACLFAAQLARHAAQRPALLVFNGCYHGGFMSYGAKDPPLSVPLPLVKATYNDVPGTRSALNAHGDSLAAVIVEPMMGSAGCIPASAEFLAMLREETQRNGALLIFDEVMTSRLAPGGVQELHGIRPDLTTLGKFWGGGFAFGAFGGARSVMKHLDMRAGGALSQGGTFNNNVMAMTAGLVGARLSAAQCPGRQPAGAAQRAWPIPGPWFPRHGHRRRADHPLAGRAHHSSRPGGGGRLSAAPLVSSRTAGARFLHRPARHAQSLPSHAGGRHCPLRAGHP